jgi:hypothetical protein
MLRALYSLLVVLGSMHGRASESQGSNNCVVAILAAAPMRSLPLGAKAIAILKKDAWPEKAAKIERMLDATHDSRRWSYQADIVGKNAIFNTLYLAKHSIENVDASDRREAQIVCGLYGAAMVAHQILMCHQNPAFPGTLQEFGLDFAKQVGVVLSTGAFAFGGGNLVSRWGAPTQPGPGKRLTSKDWQNNFVLMATVGVVGAAWNAWVLPSADYLSAALTSAKLALMLVAAQRAIYWGAKVAMDEADRLEWMKSYYLRSEDGPGLASYWEWNMNQPGVQDDFTGNVGRPTNGEMAGWWDARGLDGKEIEVAFALDTTNPRVPRLVLLAAEAER